MYVIIRNPRVVPTDELRPRDVKVDAEGKPVDEDDAMRANNEMLTRLIVGWHVYDGRAADTSQQVTLDGDEMVAPDQELLPWPPTAETVAKLPLVVFGRINEAIEESVDPQKGQGAPTPKT